MIDVQGPLAYSTRVDELLQIYFDSLKRNGKLMTHINNTHILNDRNEQVYLYEWLQTLEGLKVKTESINGVLVYSVEKISNDVQIPKLTLIKNHIETIPPPIRVFRISN